MSGRAINRSPADNENFPFLRALKRLVNAFHEFYARRLGTLMTADHDIFTVRQRLADAIESFTAHDHRMADREIFKKFQIHWKMPRQLTVFSDHPVFGDCHDVINHFKQQ